MLRWWKLFILLQHHLLLVLHVVLDDAWGERKPCPCKQRGQHPCPCYSYQLIGLVTAVLAHYPAFIPAWLHKIIFGDYYLFIRLFLQSRSFEFFFNLIKKRRVYWNSNICLYFKNQPSKFIHYILRIVQLLMHCQKSDIKTLATVIIIFEAFL